MNWDTFLRDLWFIYRIYSGLIGCQCVPEKVNSTRNMKVKKVSSTQEVSMEKEETSSLTDSCGQFFIFQNLHHEVVQVVQLHHLLAATSSRISSWNGGGWGEITLESHNFLFLIIHNGSNKSVSTDCICLCGLLPPPSAALPSAAACIPPDWLLDLAVVGAFTTTKLRCGERGFSDLMIYRFFYLAYVPESRGQYQ